MNEEEAIKKLSAKKNESTWNDTIRQIKREEIKDVVVTRQKYITTVLNLIKKQQKELEQEKEKNKKLEEDNEHLLITGARQVADIDLNYISKDKIAKILGLDSTVTTETILQYIKTLESENARLEDIENKKVQIEYELVFNKGVNSMKDKIKKELEELDNMKVGGEVFTTAVNFAKKILKELL